MQGMHMVLHRRTHKVALYTPGQWALASAAERQTVRCGWQHVRKWKRLGGFMPKWSCVLASHEVEG